MKPDSELSKKYSVIPPLSNKDNWYLRSIFTKKYKGLYPKSWRWNIYKIEKAIYEKILYYMIHSRAGVSMKNIGYFFVYTVPIPKNLVKNHIRYIPVYLPFKQCFLRHYLFEETFPKYVYKDLKERVSKGYRYLNLSLACPDIWLYPYGRSMKGFSRTYRRNLFIKKKLPAMLLGEEINEKFKLSERQKRLWILKNFRRKLQQNLSNTKAQD